MCQFCITKDKPVLSKAAVARRSQRFIHYLRRLIFCSFHRAEKELSKNICLISVALLVTEIWPSKVLIQK